MIGKLIFVPPALILIMWLVMGCSAAPATVTTHPLASTSMTASITQSEVSSLTTNSEVDLAYIQVSTGASGESYGLINKGLTVKVSCFDSKNQDISIHNMNAALSISLYDDANTLVYNNSNNQIIVNYMPNEIWNYICWIPVDYFVPYYASMSGYRKFEGSVKLALMLPGHKPVEANTQASFYLKNDEPISKEVYDAFESTAGIPLPEETPLPHLSLRARAFPLDGADNISTLPTFTWPSLGSVHDNLLSYNFRIATDEDFINIVDSKTGLPNIYSLTTPLDAGKMYFWGVQAVPIMPTGLWMTYKFTTKS
jgi:hypothetical protein